MNYLEKITLLDESKIHLRNAVDHYKLASKLRNHAGKQFGEMGGLHPFPISGGICSHWPEWAKDAVTTQVHKAQHELAQSLAKHTRAGRRAVTWRAAKAQAGI